MSLPRHLHRALKDIRQRLELIATVAAMNAERFAHLPPSDFFVKKTRTLRGPLRVFVEDYTDGPEASLHEATPIFTPGSKRTLLPLAATAACILFQRGHANVGIAVVDSTGRGVIFQYRSHEDVVCRELTELPLTGGLS